MTRPRYFFTDPLAAAWMVKAFRFKVRAGPFCLRPESLDAFYALLAAGTRADRYEIHPEIAPLLDPRVGDVVEEPGGRGKVRKLAPPHVPLTGSGCVILQRDGRPFFAPTRES